MRSGKAAAAIIGCGHISKTHLQAMVSAGIAPIGFVDIERPLAEAARAEFGAAGARACTDYEEILSWADIDIVTVATPPAVHLEQAVAALRAGKYVYCEKPVAARLADFRGLFEAERESGKAAFFTTSRFRANDGILMKEYVDAGRLGDIYRVDVKHLRGRGRPGIEYQPETIWFLDRKQAITGISGDMGMYFMDKAFHLTGWPEITSVSAQVYKQFPHTLPASVRYDVEEHIVFFARTTGDLTFSFEFANISHHEYVSSILLLGTKGGLKGTTRMEDVQLRTESEPGRPATEKPAVRDEVSGDVIAYRELAKAAAGSPFSLGTTSREALAMHRVLHMAFQSARERQEITPADIDENGELFPGL